MKEAKEAKAAIDSALSGKVIAVPESRQLDVLTDLFERRGASVIRIPLIAILDAPDQKPVVQWLRDFIKAPPDYLVVLTGEGLRRLRTAAARQHLESDFINALKQTQKICRGPKPGRALKAMGLQADMLGAQPTTTGIIATLQSLTLAGKRVAVQLYGEDPNPVLIKFLEQQNLASCTVVAPYIYASDSETDRVKQLIRELAIGRVDLIAFTSLPQVHRLFDVAKQHHMLDELRVGLERTKIAAIGPIVAAVLKEQGCRIDIMPTTAFFMKPLVTAAAQLFADEQAILGAKN